MQYALVDGKRTEPATGLKGIFQRCLQPVVPAWNPTIDFL